MPGQRWRAVRTKASPSAGPGMRTSLRMRAIGAPPSRAARAAAGPGGGHVAVAPVLDAADQQLAHGRVVVDHQDDGPRRDADEGAPPPLAGDQALRLQAGQHLAHGQGGDPELGRQRDVGGQLGVGDQLPAGDAGPQGVEDAPGPRAQVVDHVQHLPLPGARATGDGANTHRDSPLGRPLSAKP